MITSAAYLGLAHAQPAVRDHRTPPAPPPPQQHDMRRPPPPVAEGPTEAPPSPREEHQAARAGFVWVTGRWDWKARKWEWVAGHWERERAGKQWRAGHWDRSGTSWVWTEGGWIDAGAVVPPRNDHHPHQPPPTPRDERPSVKAGFTWVPGRWDWRNDQWAWVDGHWERERAGKKWRPARWENQSDTWVLIDGDWIDASATMPPPSGHLPPLPPPNGNTGIVPPHHWVIERPTVSSFWPDKGKVGSRVVIRGRNFAPDTRVMWGPDEVRAARVSNDRIELAVPANAQSATIILKANGRAHDLIVGNFEVANYDAEAEARRIEAERVAAAKAAWASQQAKYAKDAAAAQAALEARWQEMEANREQRREQRIQEIRNRWQAAFLNDPDTQSELTLHAERVADLTRAKDVASVKGNQALGVRIDVALARENDRHDQRMASLQSAFSTRGGRP
ncbi:MAG: IPT/TIG domain-containing protein [Kofleriaceae bacterium]